MDYLSAARELYRSALARRLGPPVGCSPAEVAALERRVGFPLPEAYRQYLLWMGRDYGGPFVGSQCFVTDALRNTRYLPALLHEGRVEGALPEHYLAFFMHQGYIAGWFHLPAESEDPPVYSFSPGQTSAPEQHGSFSGWLLANMRDLARYL
jgi:hypothetical protein